MSLNLHRRHLDDSQRKMVAARASVRFEEEAKHRMLAGKPAPESEQGRSVAKAAHLLNVSPSGTYQTKRVLDHGVPELVTAVERGAVPLTPEHRRLVLLALATLKHVKTLLLRLLRETDERHAALTAIDDGLRPRVH